jgi:hypothetical protein
MRGTTWTLATNLRASDSEDAAPPNEETFEDWGASDAMLVPLDAQLAGKPVSPTWLDAARAADIADMIEVSIRRSRTIDIYNETYNEQGTFKGMMGIAGCALLLVALFTLFAAAVGQKTAKFFEADWLATLFGYWHYGLLAVLVMFLLLQLLRFVVPGEGGKNVERPHEPESR